MGFVSDIQAIVIDDKSMAEDYVTDLLKNPRYRSIDVVRQRAAKNCKGEHIKKHFIKTGEAVLKSYGRW